MVVEVADVSFEGSQVRARIHLRFSKTDASGLGADVFLGLPGVRHSSRELPESTTGDPGPLFVSLDGTPVSRVTFVAVSVRLYPWGE